MGETVAHGAPPGAQAGPVGACRTGLPPALRLPALVCAGLLPQADAAPLAALRDHNPLLFDLTLKRRVRWRGAALWPTVFATRRHVQRAAVS